MAGKGVNFTVFPGDLKGDRSHQEVPGERPRLRKEENQLCERVLFSARFTETSHKTPWNQRFHRGKGVDLGEGKSLSEVCRGGGKGGVGKSPGSEKRHIHPCGHESEPRLGTHGNAKGIRGGVYKVWNRRVRVLPLLHDFQQGARKGDTFERRRLGGTRENVVLLPVTGKRPSGRQGSVKRASRCRPGKIGPVVKSSKAGLDVIPLRK